MVRSDGRSRSRANMFSLSATPRIRMMPSTAANRPSVAASTRSCAAMIIFSGRDDAEFGRRQQPRDQIADQRRDADRRQARSANSCR